jgi:hypothetical protein
LNQFAVLICRQKNLFSKIIELENYGSAYEIFDVGEMGRSSVDNIIINTVAPLLVAYGRRQGDTSFTERAQKILESVTAENNRILRSWTALGLDVKNAFDSQALIQLFNSYCVPRRCLECAIGACLLKPGP